MPSERKGCYVPQRVWSSLSAGTQKRYLGAGRRQGLTDRQVIGRYESGAKISDFRGHGSIPRGASERTWPRLLRAARASDAWPDRDEIPDILAAELSRGVSVIGLLRILADKVDSEREYRQGNRVPGNIRWNNRPPVSGIELYYYHPTLK